jgi:hypothetical protein
MEQREARRMWRALETYHGMIYFVPEGPEEYTAIGIEPGPMGYFASRSAAMGGVPAEVVIATFYNFNPSLVQGVIPRAWTLASPGDIGRARRRAVDRSLQRMLGTDVARRPEVVEALALAREAAKACTIGGRPLYAGHASLDWPDEPHVALWHAISLLREFRGDGHVAALVAQGIGPLTALVLHAGSGEVPVKLLKATRAWPDDEWADEVERQRSLGWLEGDGSLTADGRDVRQRYEDATDAAALGPWEHLGEDGCARLAELGKVLSREIVAAGGVPGRSATAAAARADDRP